MHEKTQSTFLVTYFQMKRNGNDSFFVFYINVYLHLDTHLFAFIFMHYLHTNIQLVAVFVSCHPLHGQTRGGG